MRPASTPELTAQIREILGAHFSTRRFRRGQLLWRESEEAEMMVAIRSGRVKIYRLLPNGKAVTLLLFGPDDVFGFLPFLDGQPYPAYAQALDDVEADVISRSTFLNVLRQEPELAVSLIAFLGRRLRDAFEMIQSLSTRGVRARVAMALLPLLPEDQTEGPWRIALPVSSKDFSEAIGIAPESFSRAIAALEEAEVLEKEKAGRFVVRDREALAQAADPGLN